MIIAFVVIKKVNKNIAIIRYIVQNPFSNIKWNVFLWKTQNFHQ